jgi:predicted methyltransferase
MRRFATLLACLMFAAPTLHAAEIPDYIAKAVAAPERSDKDRERDARDKPAELLAFAGLRPGMDVADFFGGGGYWSDLRTRRRPDRQRHPREQFAPQLRPGRPQGRFGKTG